MGHLFWTEPTLGSPYLGAVVYLPGCTCPMFEMRTPACRDAGRVQRVVDYMLDQQGAGTQDTNTENAAQPRGPRATTWAENLRGSNVSLLMQCMHVCCPAVQCAWQRRAWRMSYSKCIVSNVLNL